MKKLLYLSLIAISLTLMACPYEGDVALCTYEEAYKTDKKLFDIWVAYDEEGGRDEVKIEKGNKAVMFLSHKRYEKGNKLKSIEKYRAFATLINNEMLFTIEKPDGKYHYCRYAWTSKNEFYVQFIEEDFMESNFSVDTVTTENLIESLEVNLGKDALYSSKMEFYRKYSPEYEKVRIFMKKSGF